MRCLVTRPQPDAEHTASLLRAAGHDALVAPLTVIEAVGAAIATSEYGGVLMTSANAARMLTPQLREALRALPVIAVGDATASAARQAGFANVTSASGDAASLAASASAMFPAGARLLYLAGEDRARDLSALMTASGSKVETLTVYRARAAGHFPQEAAVALQTGKLDAALHFSRRGAALALDYAAAADLREPFRKLSHYCLSAQVAQALGGCANIVISRTPNEAALLATLAR